MTLFINYYKSFKLMNKVIFFQILIEIIRLFLYNIRLDKIRRS